MLECLELEPGLYRSEIPKMAKGFIFIKFEFSSFVLLRLILVLNPDPFFLDPDPRVPKRPDRQHWF